mgnify:CR=1 FL=1|jgi:CubicO group peptidase (beta-lactamase class C family)
MKLKKLRIPMLIVFLAVIVLGIIFGPTIRRVLAFKEGMEMENIEQTFIKMNDYLPYKTIPKSSKPFIFPKTENISLPAEFDFQETSFNTSKYIDSSYTQGLLVLQNDTIIYENYWRGLEENIPHIAWSVSKSYISALFGIAMEEGYIKSVQQTVEEYLPELVGSGYEGVKIKDVLQMSSGVKFDETYGDMNSDINKFWLNFVSGQAQMKLIKELKNYRTPGTYNEYVSTNTDILGLIIARATGRPLSNYLYEKILEPIGTEFEAYWITDGEGTELSHGGLNICLRDFAKFGRLYLNEGNWNGKQIIPLDWFESSTHSIEEYLQPGSQNSTVPWFGYGYQWWLIDGNEDEILAVGVFNQHIYVNQKTNTVIVKNSANRNYYDLTNPYVYSQVHLELYRKIAHLND